jgi:nitrate reductase alpha subunit
VCEAILALDPASNGELAYRAFEAEEKKTGRVRSPNRSPTAYGISSIWTP